MQQAFVGNEVAVLVRHWLEIDLADSHLEHGARIELRLLAEQPRRGSESAAQKIVVDQPMWRADLFDRLDGSPGAFEAAHFHPYFRGVEPCERHWPDAIRTAPWDWLADQLSDVSQIVFHAGGQLRDPTTANQQVREVMADIVAAARRRAGSECRSTQQCYAWAKDAEPAVHAMLGALARPDLLDTDRVTPWLRSRAAATP